MKVSFIWDKAAGAFFVRDADTGEVQTLANGARWYITCTKCHKGRIVARYMTEDSIGVCTSCGEEFPPTQKYCAFFDFCDEALKLINDHQGDYSEIVEEVEAVQVEQGYIKPMVQSPDEFAAIMREAAKNKEASRPTKNEKRALLEKMLVLLEDALSLEREPTYNHVPRGWPISCAIRDEILHIATDESEEGVK